MAKKKSVKKKAAPKKTKSEKSLNIEKALIENFIGLQKVMLNMSTKFEDLTDQISKLLNLFEVSAKALAEKDHSKEKSSQNEKKIIEKLDNLGEQNKILAKGITLLHEGEEAIEAAAMPEEKMPPIPRPPKPLPMRPMMPPRKPLPPKPQETQNPEEPVDFNQYQKSISSSEKSDKNIP